LERRDGADRRRWLYRGIHLFCILIIYIYSSFWLGDTDDERKHTDKSREPQDQSHVRQPTNQQLRCQRIDVKQFTVVVYRGAGHYPSDDQQYQRQHRIEGNCYHRNAREQFYEQKNNGGFDMTAQFFLVQRFFYQRKIEQLEDDRGRYDAAAR